MKFRLNPIVKKDLQVTARSMRLSWGLFAYEAVLACAFALTLAVIQTESNSLYSNNMFGSMVSLFPVIAITQVCIVALIVPLLTASSISGERERQTFDIMLTTCMSPLAIVFGKVMSAVLRILFFVVASTPIMAMAFVVGGLSWLDLFYFLLVITLLSIFWGSIGILCSAICRRAITAVIMSFAIYFVVHTIGFVPIIIQMLLGGRDAGESLLGLLFNPIVFLEEFFMKIMTGDSALSDNFSKHDVGVLTYLLTKGDLWVIVSGFCILLLAILFMLIAAWRVNPLYAPAGRKVKEKR